MSDKTMEDFEDFLAPIVGWGRKKKDQAEAVEEKVDWMVE